MISASIHRRNIFHYLEFCGSPLRAKQNRHGERGSRLRTVCGDGNPTRIANSDYDVREFDKNLAAAEKIGERVFRVPWLKKHIPEQIEEYANAFKKVVENYEELLEGDTGNPERISGWHFFQQKESK